MKDQTLHRITFILIVGMSSLSGWVAGVLFRQLALPELQERAFPVMVSILPHLPFAHALPPQEIIQPYEVRPLPGKLDNVVMFNSNSPEWIKQEGILGF